GYVMAAFTARRQALHDKIAGTIVVNYAAGPCSLPARGFVAPIGAKPGCLIAAALVLSTAVEAAMRFLVAPYLIDEPNDQRVTQEEGPGGDATAREDIAYAIYSRSFFGSKPQFVKEGVRHYRHSDVRTAPGPARDVPNTLKTLEIADGYE